MLGIVIPVYNEEVRLPATLVELKARFAHACVVVSDDGSTDRTADIANAHGVRVVRRAKNRGKGWAVWEGIQEALRLGCDPVLFADCDLACPPSEWGKLLAALRRGADVAIASRYLRGSVVTSRSRKRALASRGYAFLARMATGLPHRDFQCGFKAFTAQAARVLFTGEPVCGRWSFDTEVLLRAGAVGLEVVEVPVVWHEKEGSKVRLLRDALLMLRALFQLRRVYLSAPTSETEEVRWIVR